MNTIRTRLAGLIALLGIVAILLGVPWLLVTIGATPIPEGLPTWDQAQTALTSSDDGTLLFAVLAVTAWVAWAFLALSLLLEIVSAIRDIPTPRLPGLSLPQGFARGLVAVAAGLFIVAPSVATAADASATTPVPSEIATTQQYVSPSAAAVETPEATPAVQSTETAERTVVYQVKDGDTLWSIAEEHLGDGARYPEIVEINRGVPQPDGHALHDPDWIHQGWKLSLPDTATTLTETSSASVSEHTVVEGDTLWDLAEEHLGDGARYPEIVEATTGTQPGGSTLTDPDVIDVGWTITIPGATATDEVSSEAQTTITSDPAPEPVEKLTPPVPEEPAPADAVPAPEQATDAADTAAPLGNPSPVSDASADITASSDIDDEESGWPVRTEAGVGALLAAGVLTLLAVRRRNQQRHRRPGQQLPMPQEDTAQTEQELRATADVLSMEAIDVALRTLSKDCAALGQSLPTVRAARLTVDQFDLYLAEPCALPSPWTGTVEATVWTLHLDNTTDQPAADVAATPAPYPALVVIGHDEEDGHVLLDLEYLGALGVTGNTEVTQEVLAALAVELATSRWADDLQVTVVGAFADLEDTLQTGRIRYVPSADQVLADLTVRAEQDRDALHAAGTANLQTARVTGSVPDAWAPEIVLLTGPVTDRQREQLNELVETMPRVAVAAVTGDLSVGEWALDLSAHDDPEMAILAPIGLTLRPQRLPAKEYGHLLDMVSLSDVEELNETAQIPADIATVSVLDPSPARAEHTPEIEDDLNVDVEEALIDDPADPAAADDPEVSEPAISGETKTTDDPIVAADVVEDPDLAGAITEVIPASHSDVDDQVDSAEIEQIPLPAPKILALGPVEILNATGKVEPTKRPRLLEYAAFLALNPAASATAIDDAVWPNRKKDENFNTRHTATSKLRRWLGADVSGEPYLPRHPVGDGYTMHPDVTTDVDEWDTLLAEGPMQAPSENLEAALALVRGRPFQGHHRRYYAWTERLTQRLASEIADASYELARRRLMEGRHRAAEEAIVVGLSIEPAIERLWRMRILAAHESRNPAAEAEAIDRLLAIAEELEFELEPETDELLTELKNPAASFDQLLPKAL